jgi:SAM-dependent methyltransferase
MGMQQTKYFRYSQEMLAEFRDQAEKPAFWSNLWSHTDFENYFKRYENGYLGVFKNIFKKYLPKNSPILEAVCGRGQYVYALSQLGYDMLGVDFSAELINKIKTAKSNLNVHVGDVRNLQFEDESLGAYISLGVVEHFWNGMDDILSETYRVLKKDGILLLSVPHFSPRFQKLAQKNFVSIPEPMPTQLIKEFYQFYFSKPVIENKIKKYRFEPIDTFYYDSLYGAKRAMPMFLKIHDNSYIIRSIARRINKMDKPQFIFRKFAHMVMIIAIKK